MNTDRDTEPLAPQAHSPFVRGNSFLSSDDENSLTSRRRSRPHSIKGTHGTYLLGETLGSGVTSVVRAGIHTETLLVVAVKVLDLHRLRRHPGGVDRVNAEIRILRELSKKPHRNVIALKDLVRDDAKRKIYLVLEMANGTPVQNLIQEEGQGDMRQGRRLPHTQVANIIAQVLSALEYVHERGFVHRDVKPANLLLTSAGVIKLSDFGVSESLDRYDASDSVTRTSGTPAFQAPEIADGEESYSGTKVDVWALGVTAFYMLCGELPFNALTHIQLYNTITEGKYQFPSDLKDELPADAVDAIEKMLRVNFKERWSVDQLLHHPWITSARKPLPMEEQIASGWMHVDAKTFNVLELAMRYMETDGQFPSSPSTDSQSLAAERSGFSASLFSPPPPPTFAVRGQSSLFSGGLFDPPSPNQPVGDTHQRPEKPLLTPSSSDSDSLPGTSRQFPSTSGGAQGSNDSRGRLDLLEEPVVQRQTSRRIRAGIGGFGFGAQTALQHQPKDQEHSVQVRSNLSGVESDSGTDSDAELAAALSGAQVTRWPAVGIPDAAPKQSAVSADTDDIVKPASNTPEQFSGVEHAGSAGIIENGDAVLGSALDSPDMDVFQPADFTSDTAAESDAELAAALDGAEVTRWSDLGDPLQQLEDRFGAIDDVADAVDPGQNMPDISGEKHGTSTQDHLQGTTNCTACHGQCRERTSGLPLSKRDSSL